MSTKDPEPDWTIRPHQAAPPTWRVLWADFTHTMSVWNYYWMFEAMTAEDSLGSLLWTNEYVARVWAAGERRKLEPFHPDVGTSRDPSGSVFIDDHFGTRDLAPSHYGPLRQGGEYWRDDMGGSGTGIESWTPELRPRRWDDEFIYSPAAGRMMTNAEYYRTDGPPIPKFGRYRSWESRDNELRRWQARLPDPNDPRVWQRVVRPEFAQRLLVDHPVFIAFCRTGHLPPGVETIDDVLRLPGEPARRPSIPPFWQEMEYETSKRMPLGSAWTDGSSQPLTDERIWREFLRRFPEGGDDVAHGPADAGPVSQLTLYRSRKYPRRRVVPSDFSLSMDLQRYHRLLEEMTIEDSWGSVLLQDRQLAIRYAIGLVFKRAPFRHPDQGTVRDPDARAHVLQRQREAAKWAAKLGPPMGESDPASVLREHRDRAPERFVLD